MWSYCISRKEVLVLDTGKVVGDPQTSILERLCCEGGCLPPVCPAEAWLQAEQSRAVLAADGTHTYML